MKFIELSTKTPNTRDQVYTMIREDTALFNSDIEIQDVPTPSKYSIPFFNNVFEAMASGYRLIGPPVKNEFTQKYDWYLSKE